MDRIKKLKIKKQDGTFSDYIPIGADAENIDTTDGESVQLKLNKKPYYYDNVAAMKADTKLKVGDMAITLGYYNINDNGGAKYKIVNTISQTEYQEELINNLYATLIINNNEINIKQIGANSSNDIGNLVNNILNKGYNVFVPDGNYIVTTTINPPSYSKLKINGTLNNSSANDTFKIENDHIDMYIEKIITTGTGLPILIESNANSTKCMYNIISIGNIDSSQHGIYLHAIKKGIVYNIINFKSISAGNSYYGIYIKTEYNSAKSYINENTINGGKLSGGLYGLYIDTGTYTDNHEVNGMKFYNLCFEGVTNGVYMNNARWNKVINPRTAELSGLYVYLKGKADGNVFDFVEQISYSKFDIHELDSGYSYNYFNGIISDSGGGRIGKDFITYNKKLQIRELLHKTRWMQIADQQIPKDEEQNPLPYYIPNDRIGNYFYMSSTLSPKIYLNQCYGSVGLNEIFVTGRTSKPFKLYDNYENLIWDYDGVTAERKHFYCRDNTDSSAEIWFEG